MNSARRPSTSNTTGNAVRPPRVPTSAAAAALGRPHSTTGRTSLPPARNSATASSRGSMHEAQLPRFLGCGSVSTTAHSALSSLAQQSGSRSHRPEASATKLCDDSFFFAGPQGGGPREAGAAVPPVVVVASPDASTCDVDADRTSDLDSPRSAGDPAESLLRLPEQRHAPPAAPLRAFGLPSGKNHDNSLSASSGPIYALPTVLPLASRSFDASTLSDLVVSSDGSREVLLPPPTAPVFTPVYMRKTITRAEALRRVELARKLRAAREQ